MLPNCCTCGRFTRVESGCSWKMVYDGGPIPTPSHELIQCLACTETHGPLSPQHGVRPEYSTGIVQQRTEGRE